MSEQTSRDLLQAFVQGAHQKLDELYALLDALFDDGPRPSLMETIYRISFSIKSLAAACDFQNIVEYICLELDTNFNRIRVQNQRPTELLQSNLRTNMNNLRAMINQIASSAGLAPAHWNGTDASSGQERPPFGSDGEGLDTHGRMAAVGQLSTWSFHELINHLAKAQGYTETLEEIAQVLGEIIDGNASPSKLKDCKNDLTGIQSKITVSIDSMLNIINRLRSLRGKIQNVSRDYPLRDLISMLSKDISFVRHTLGFTLTTLPNVSVNVEKLLFEQVWLCLWRLLAEWRDPGIPVRAMCTSTMKIGEKHGSEVMPDQVFIYLWLEPENLGNKFLPEKLHYHKETPRPDLSNIFEVCLAAAQKTGIQLLASETPSGFPIFSIGLTCLMHNPPFSVPQSAPTQPHREANRILSLGLTGVGNSAGEPVDPLDPVILVVDDDTDLTSLLVSKLSKMGYHAVSAENVTEAKTCLKERNIQLILSDLFLSQESGLELLREVKNSGQEISFVFMSGANEDDVPAAIFNVLQKYSNEFLQKPISTLTLRDIVFKYLGAPATKS